MVTVFPQVFVVIGALACGLVTLTDRVTVVRAAMPADTLIDTDAFVASARVTDVDPDAVVSRTRVLLVGQVPEVVQVAPMQAVAVKSPSPPVRVRV